MPKYTPHYKLAAFLGSDTYSASLDKERFTIIDNQAAFISDVLGDGVIRGWNTTDSTSGGQLSIITSFGSGIVNRFVTQTFFDIKTDIEENKELYVYLNRKEGIFPTPHFLPKHISNGQTRRLLRPQQD